jgi:hypothetical protein
MAPDSLEPAVAALLATVGRGGAAFRLEPLSASGNNRVFTLLSGDEKLVLKWYFHDAADERDRLAAEYAFLEHAWSIGLRCVPRPIGKDLTQHLAIYEFVEGRKLEPPQVDGLAMSQAAQFLANLNSPESRAAAGRLPSASEACFSVAEHFAMVDARLARFDAMRPQSDVDTAAALFVKQLEQFWAATKTQLRAGCEAMGLSFDVELPSEARCLSPSDFGFHNALVRPGGSLCFIDFEYAGWDDPAKAVGDFFSHPGVPVPHDQFEQFLAQVLTPFDHSESVSARVRLLEPMFQVKWCCIILNEFLPAGARRRNFANPGIDAEQRKQRQLAKAKNFFELIQN